MSSLPPKRFSIRVTQTYPNDPDTFRSTETREPCPIDDVYGAWTKDSKGITTNYVVAKIEVFDADTGLRTILHEPVDLEIFLHEVQDRKIIRLMDHIPVGTYLTAIPTPATASRSKKVITSKRIKASNLAAAATTTSNTTHNTKSRAPREPVTVNVKGTGDAITIMRVDRVTGRGIRLEGNETDTYIYYRLNTPSGHELRRKFQTVTFTPILSMDQANRLEYVPTMALPNTYPIHVYTKIEPRPPPTTVTGNERKRLRAEAAAAAAAASAAASVTDDSNIVLFSSPSPLLISGNIFQQHQQHQPNFFQIQESFSLSPPLPNTSTSTKRTLSSTSSRRRSLPLLKLSQQSGGGSFNSHSSATVAASSTRTSISTTPNAEGMNGTKSATTSSFTFNTSSTNSNHGAIVYSHPNQSLTSPSSSPSPSSQLSNSIQNETKEIVMTLHELSPYEKHMSLLQDVHKQLTMIKKRLSHHAKQHSGLMSIPSFLDDDINHDKNLMDSILDFDITKVFDDEQLDGYIKHTDHNLHVVEEQMTHTITTEQLCTDLFSISPQGLTIEFCYAADVNHDEDLSIDELSDYSRKQKMFFPMSKSSAKHLHEEMDTDGNGKLEYHEFLSWVNHRENELIQLFHQLDVDHDEYLDLNELRNVEFTSRLGVKSDGLLDFVEYVDREFSHEVPDHKISLSEFLATFTMMPTGSFLEKLPKANGFQMIKVDVDEMDDCSDLL
jgi:hypothetical protein